MGLLLKKHKQKKIDFKKKKKCGIIIKEKKILLNFFIKDKFFY